MRARDRVLGGRKYPHALRSGHICLDVLGELVRGARNGEIAASLGISERTVKAHLTHIYQKLGVDSRAGAVATALGRSLI